MIDRLKIRPILDGVRGATPSDVAALAHAVSRMSVVAEDLGDLVDAIDVNPVIVSPTGCVAVAQDEMVKLLSWLNKKRQPVVVLNQP